MQRFVVTAAEASPQTPTRGLIEAALDSKQEIPVVGQKEGVGVEFSLSVSKVARERRNGNFMLRFSGVARPGEQPYVAEAPDEPAREPVAIDVTLGPA